MIFNVPEHIGMIRDGIKTQTRRMKRSYYQIETERKYPHEIGYAVQRKRGATGEPDIKIVMDRIWKERYAQYLCCYISEEDARAEGGYKSPIEFEEVFRKLNPKWAGDRGVFEFHVIEVRK